MSEYQYYEFQAIDRPLTKTEQQELRACSTRATITSRHFANEYHWGDLKAHPLSWMKRYFDAHLYTSNFGSRAVHLRLPLNSFDAALVQPYLIDYSLTLAETSEHLIFCFHSDEDAAEWTDGGEDNEVLDTIVPIRGALARGDLRSLYLGWLRGLQSGSVQDATPEPPVPPGLAALDDEHESLATFLQIDPDLLAVAAATSAALFPKLSASETAPAWLATLTSEEKHQWLLRFLADEDGTPETEFRQHFQRSLPAPSSTDAPPPRTGGSLLQSMAQAALIRHAALARERSAALLVKQQKAAVARRAYLESHKGREEYLWKSVYSLTATNTPTNYASAVNQLTDLRDLAELTGETAGFRLRLTELRERHHRKTALLGRFNSAGLM